MSQIPSFGYTRKLDSQAKSPDETSGLVHGLSSLSSSPPSICIIKPCLPHLDSTISIQGGANTRSHPRPESLGTNPTAAGEMSSDFLTKSWGLLAMGTQPQPKLIQAPGWNSVGWPRVRHDIRDLCDGLWSYLSPTSLPRTGSPNAGITETESAQGSEFRRARFQCLEKAFEWYDTSCEVGGVGAKLYKAPRKAESEEHTASETQQHMWSRLFRQWGLGSA